MLIISKKLFKPLELNEKGLCKVCERILTIALLICMSLSLACCNTNTNTKPTVDSSNQSDNTGIANSSSDNTSSDNVNQNKSLLIDETDFDINNDQTTEHLSMEYGGTSGLFTFVFTVQEQGNYYKTFFNTDHYEFSFAEKEGTMQVKAQHDDTTTYFDIDFNANSPLITLRQGETVLSGVYMPYRQAHTLDEYNAVEQLVRD